MTEVARTRIDDTQEDLPTLADLTDTLIVRKYGGNKSAFARAINTSPQWVERIVKGQVRKPDASETLDNLLRELGLSRAEYLVIVGDITQDDLAMLGAEVWTPEQRRLAEAAGRMEPAARKTLMDLADLLLDQQGETRERA